MTPSHEGSTHCLVQPEFHGMVLVEGGSFSGIQKMAVRWPARLKQAAALCHSLNLIAKSQVVGDLADKQAFKAVEARFQVTLGTYVCKQSVIHCTVT